MTGIYAWQKYGYSTINIKPVYCFDLSDLTDEQIKKLEELIDDVDLRISE